ncbi:MAG: hypothetical protein HYS65_15145 [Betaproteobacteria bacterium]|nr:hypothetical protein [Betaproteobacteria bacterium]
MPLVRHKIQRYGWVADTPDQRNHLYAAPVIQRKKLSPKIDLDPHYYAVSTFDQFEFGG